MRMFYISSYDKWVTLGQYLKAIKRAKANPKETFPRGLTSWWPTTGAEIMRQFMRGVHDRISQGIPYSERGRREATCQE